MEVDVLWLCYTSAVPYLQFLVDFNAESPEHGQVQGPKVSVKAATEDKTKPSISWSSLLTAGGKWC